MTDIRPIYVASNPYRLGAGAAFVLLLPVLIFGLGSWAFDWLISAPTVIFDSVPDFTVKQATAMGSAIAAQRLRVVLTFGVAMTAALAAVAYAVSVISRMAIGRPGQLRELPGMPISGFQSVGTRPAGLLGIAFVASLALLWVVEASSGDLDPKLGLGVFQATLGCSPPLASYDPAAICSARPIGDATDLDLLHLVINVGNLGFIFATMFVLVAVFSLYPGRPSGSADGTETPELAKEEKALVVAELYRRVRMLKNLLTIAGAVLVTGVLLMTAWRGWPKAFMPDEVPASALKLQAARLRYDQFIGATVEFQAIMFAVVLVAVFLPMAIWLGRATEESFHLVNKDGSEADKAAWLDKNRLTFDIRERFQNLFVIVSPVLAPALVRIVEGVAGSG